MDKTQIKQSLMFLLSVFVTVCMFQGRASVESVPFTIRHQHFGEDDSIGIDQVLATLPKMLVGDRRSCSDITRLQALPRLRSAC
jgi:hypothetical protein